MELIPYNSSLKEEWNSTVEMSKNGTFLFNRSFMEYHSDRFEDCSLMFFDKKRCIACLPANIDRTGRTVYSHQGLTYGGLVMLPRVTGGQLLEMFSSASDYFRSELKAHTLFYKPVPHIYCRYPSEEDLYAIFRSGGKLAARGLSSAIPLSSRIPFTESRKGGIRKAKASGLRVVCVNDVEAYWHLLDETLTTCHSVHPVHTASELKLLMERFPDNIRLYNVFAPDDRLLGGCLLFVDKRVVHVQYIAANAEGKSCGALDLLFNHIISEAGFKQEYLDFGVSTEKGGTVLNEGLLFQKEGFGGRGVAYDTYAVEL